MERIQVKMEEYSESHLFSLFDDYPTILIGIRLNTDSQELVLECTNMLDSSYNKFVTTCEAIYQIWKDIGPLFAWESAYKFVTPRMFVFAIHEG